MARMIGPHSFSSEDDDEMVVKILPENRTYMLEEKNSLYIPSVPSFMWKLLENVNKTFVLIIKNKTVEYQYISFFVL